MGKMKTTQQKRIKKSSRSSVPYSLAMHVDGNNINAEVVWTAPTVLDYQQTGPSTASIQLDFDGAPHPNRTPTPEEARLQASILVAAGGSGGKGNVTVTRAAAGWIWHDANLIENVPGGERKKRVEAAARVGLNGELFSSLQDLLWFRELQNNATLRSDLQKLVA